MVYGREGQCFIVDVPVLCKAGKQMLFWPFPDRLELEPDLYLMFYDLNGFVKPERNDAQYNDTCDYHIQLEYP